MLNMTVINWAHIFNCHQFGYIDVLILRLWIPWKNEIKFEKVQRTAKGNLNWALHEHQDGNDLGWAQYKYVSADMCIDASIVPNHTHSSHK